MQQRIRNLALFVGGAALVSGGLLMVACGTDNGSTATPTVDGGGGTGKDTGTAKDGSTTDPDGSTTDTDAGTDADCSKVAKLRDNSASFYCAFKRADAGVEAGAYCANAETCCNPDDKIGADFAPSFCAAGTKAGDAGEANCAAAASGAGSAFTSGSAWECADKTNCASGVCCLIQDPTAPAGKTLNIGTVPKTNALYACGAQQAYYAGGTRCKASCAAADYKLCSLSDQNCGAGTTCTPFQGFFRDLGYCK